MKIKRKLKKKYVVFLSSYALLLISYFTMTTFAKYTSLLNVDGKISVAKWDVSIAGQDNIKLPTMYIGDSNTYQSYELSVTSKSETATNYSAIISNVPDGVQIQVDDNDLYSESNNVITIENLGSFNATDINNTHKHKFTILVPFGTNPFSDQQLDIDVIFTQID